MRGRGLFAALASENDDELWLKLMSVTSTLKTLVVVGVALLASGLESSAEARMAALEVELPSVQEWKIGALKRGSSVMCSARQAEVNGQRGTLLADTGKYRGGVWFLDVVSLNQHLESDILEAPAQLYLNGKQVGTGKVLDVGNWTGKKRTATYVRYEFPVIDAYVKDIKAARIVEVRAQGLSPLKLESLSPIITALENCQQESSNPAFWKDAKHVCN